MTYGFALARAGRPHARHDTSHTNSSHTRRLNPGLAALAAGVSIAALCIGVAQPAFAGDECGNDVAGVATCTAASGVGNPYPGGINYVGDPGEDITVVLTGGAPATAVQVSTGGYGVVVESSYGNDAYVQANAGAAIDATGNGVTVTAIGGGYAAVHNDADISTGGVAIEVTAQAGGLGATGSVFNSADLFAAGDTTGKLETAAGIIVAAGGPALVANYGDIMVTSTSDSEAMGISVRSAFSYGYVNNYGDLTVYNTGGTASGITVSGATDTDLLSSGDVQVYGQQTVVGLSVQSGGGTAHIEADGGVAVLSTDTIATAVSGQTDRDSVTISVSGDIYAFGRYGGVGVDAQAARDATVAVQGDVGAASGSGYAIGVHMQARGYADIYVNGSIQVEAAGVAYGIYADAANVDIDVSGGIVAYSANNQATGALALGDDYASVSVHGPVEVTSAGLAAYGVLVNSAYGSASAYLDDVSVTGPAGAAVYVHGQDGAAMISAGSIESYGVDGVVVRAWQGQAYAQVVDVMTTADYAPAVDVRNLYGYAVAVAFGDIVTFGYGSQGLLVASTYGATYATSSGRVETYGAGSTGIDVASQYGDAWITNHGEVITHGANAFGLDARAPSGTVMVIENGSVLTYGSGSIGIFAAGDGVSLSGSGSVLTYGDSATGIRASGDYGVNIEMPGGEVESWGYLAYGVNAFSIGAETAVNIGAVQTHGDRATGISAVSQGSSPGDYVDVEAGFVRTYGAQAAGVFAFAQTGDVRVDVGTVNTLGQSSQGVTASANGGGNLLEGTVYVDFGSVRTYGDEIYLGGVALDGGGYALKWGSPSTAINAYSANGSVQISGADVLTEGVGATGIWASGVGEVHIQVDAVNTLGDAPLIAFGPGGAHYGSGAIGIDARVRGGDIRIEAGTVRTQGDYAEGIRTHTFGLDTGSGVLWGKTYIQAQNVYTFGDYSDAIQANSNVGTILVTGNTAVTYGDWSDGVEATAYTYVLPNLSVVLGEAEVDTHALHTYGDYARGFDVTAFGGDASSNVYSVTTVGAHSTGAFLRAYTFFGSNGGTASGDVDATVTYVSTLGDYSTGIDAYAQGGDVSVLSQFVYTGGDFAVGVGAIANLGRVDVTVERIVTTGDHSDGLIASSFGGEAYVDVGEVKTYGTSSDAISVSAQGANGEIHLSTRDFVYAVHGTGIIGVADAYSIFHIDDGSEVRGFNAGIVSQTGTGSFVNIDAGGTVTGLSGAAIDANGAAASIHNYGHLNGFVDLTGNADLLDNQGVWEARGTSAFGSGNDVVSNYGTVFFRGIGGLGTTTSMTGLEGFNSHGLVSGVDNQVNDVLSMASTVFTGSKGSQLGLDVQFGGAGSSADRLVIGRAIGVTKIVPTAVLGQNPGGLNLNGILVVDSAYASQTGAEFTMTAVPKGLVTYSLKFDAPTDNWLIVGLPSKGSGLLANLPTGNGPLILPGHAPIGAGRHLAELRGGPASALGFSEADEQSVDIGGLRFWSRSEGDADLGAAGFLSGASADGTFSGSAQAMQFGVDRRDGDTVWGVTSGYLRQQAEATDGGGRFDLEGLNVAAYASWASDGWFGNLGLSGGFQTLDAQLAGAARLDPVNAITFGLQGEAGYRFEHEGRWFIEPVAALGWSNTRADDLVAGPARLDFAGGDSVTGKAGVRMGWTLASDHAVLTPTLGLYAIEAFTSPDRARLVSGDDSVRIGDPRAGTYGVAEFGATLRTDWGVEGFVSGVWNLGGEENSGGARVGARWRW